MTLTAQDVNDKSFSIERKGYNIDEIDVFLEQVAASINELNATIADLNSQLQAAQSTPVLTAVNVDQSELDKRDARIRELEARLADRRADDSAISQALIVAQRSADEIVANANGVAESTRQDAKDEAQRILDKANAEKQRVLDQIKKLEEEREGVRDQFSEMLNDFIGSSHDLLNDLDAGKGIRSRGSHRLPSRTMTSTDSIDTTPAATDSASSSGAVAATYTTPTVSSVVVAPATPKPKIGEKDFSGFGDVDDGFELDDID